MYSVCWTITMEDVSARLITAASTRHWSIRVHVLYLAIHQGHSLQFVLFTSNGLKTVNHLKINDYEKGHTKEIAFRCKV